MTSQDEDVKGVRLREHGFVRPSAIAAVQHFRPSRCGSIPNYSERLLYTQYVGGDGSAATVGTVAAIPGGDWVVGNHTYAKSGPYTIIITVKEGGFTVVATAESFDPPAVPGGPSRHFHRATAHAAHRTHASRTNGTAKPHRQAYVNLIRSLPGHGSGGST